METGVYKLDSEIFYVVPTPNGYFLVTHGGFESRNFVDVFVASECA